ncbi:hypothetical protein HZS_6765, partial [Henneguya salminicola]
KSIIILFQYVFDSSLGGRNGSKTLSETNKYIESSYNKIQLLYQVRVRMRDLLKLPQRICGSNKVVTINEGFFFKPTYNAGRKMSRRLVFVGIRRYDKSKIFMATVPDRKLETLISLIIANI